MSNARTRMVIAYTLQKANNTDPFTAGFEAPLGAEPFQAQSLGEGGIGILCHVDPRAVLVWYPVVAAPPGVEFDLMIGKSVGAFIGVAALGGDLVCIFRQNPWPTTALEGIRTEGNG